MQLPANPLSRRTVLAGTFATMSISAVAACSNSSGSSDGGSSGGTLTVGFDNEPLTLDPAMSAAISSDRNVLNLFYDTLLRQDRDGSFEPALAKSWKKDDRSITFTLRDGVKFHDGTPFDAKAVVFSLERVMNPATKSTKAGALSKIESVKAVEPSTVKITLKSPDPLLLTHLAHEPGMIVSPKAVGKYGGDFNRNPVGTGPFTFKLWRSKVQLTAERNENYWAKASDGSALPKLDKVIYRFVTEAKVLRAELSTGGVQLVRALPPEEYRQLESNSSISIKDEGVRRAYYVSLNTTRPPFDNPEVRAAFAQAVDVRAVGKAAAGDEFDVAPSFATKKDWFYDGSLPVPSYNPDAAREALERATNGKGAAVTLLARRRAPDPTIAELLQNQLKKAGFTVEVAVLEFQTMLERLLKHDFDAGMLVIDIPRLDPSLSFDPYFSSAGPNNWSGIKDTKLDGLLERGRVTEDRAERKKIYSDVQRRLLDRNYWVFLHQPKSPLVNSSKLKGVVLNADGQVRLDQAHLTS
ncbi:ABC transporter substrate-binding protein [Streptomyces sp. NPDC004082]|uniref:ABC transporter substrate-binding protein n=1 Tax=Streptomyces sp. NPDC005481 TaxID=3154881 RepID=UPI0033AF192C